MARKVIKSDGAQPGPTRSRLEALGRVAGRFQDWRPAREVLTRVQAVPTVFPQINRGTRVGGWPLQRICLVHGPSNMGKTILAHGLGLSFLRAGHYYCFVDAEFSSTEDWVKELMSGMADYPSFLAQHPRSYEQTTESVRRFVVGVSQARSAGDLPQDTSGLLVVDSLRKLIPERQREAIAKKEGGVDGMSGRMAMYKAMLNSAWMDELVPLLYHTNMSMLFIGREAENVDKGMVGEKWKLTGGAGIVFDSSILARVVRAEWVKAGDRIVGERHLVSIWKTKIGGKDDKVIDCYFHTSNGALVPVGFDRARDVLELARGCGVVTTSGSWLRWEEQRRSTRWNGVAAAVKALTEDPDLLAELEREVEDHG